MPRINGCCLKITFIGSPKPPPKNRDPGEVTRRKHRRNTIRVRETMASLNKLACFVFAKAYSASALNPRYPRKAPFATALNFRLSDKT
jgi:hypothetical protein